MKFLLLLIIPLLSFGFPPSDNATVEADFLIPLNQALVNVPGDFSVDGTTTLDTALTGFLKATSGVISAQALIDLTSDITGVLPIANGGTGSASQNFVDLTTDQSIAGRKTFSGELEASGVVSTALTTDAASTGANVQLSTPGTEIVRVTNASLTSIDMIIAPTRAQKLVFINHTGVTIALNNATGATAANQIFTGTGSNLDLDDQASVNLIYDTVETKWMVVGGSGSGGATPTTTEGDLIVRGTTEDIRFPKALTNNENLVSDDSVEGGLRWSDTISGSLNNNTDMILGTCTTPMTNTTVICRYAQSADRILVTGRINFSAVPVGAFSISTPDGLVIDSSKMESATQLNLGRAEFAESGVGTIAGRARYAGTGDVSFQYYIEQNETTNATRMQSVNVAAPFIFNNTDWVNFEYEVPIVGWTSGTTAIVQNQVLKTAIGASNLGTGFTSIITDIPFIEVEDANGIWSGSTFTVPVGGAGYWDISGQVYLSGASTTVPKLYVNTVDTKRKGPVSSSIFKPFNFLQKLEVGDVVSIRMDSTGTLAVGALNHYIDIVQRPPTVINVAAISGLEVNSYAETNNTNVRDESCRIDNPGTPGKDNDLCDNWVDSLTDHAPGDTTINFILDTFSDVPVCVATIISTSGAGGARIINLVNVNATSVRFQTWVDGGAKTDIDFSVSCKGKI